MEDETLEQEPTDEFHEHKVPCGSKPGGYGPSGMVYWAHESLRKLELDMEKCVA